MSVYTYLLNGVTWACNGEIQRNFVLGNKARHIHTCIDISVTCMDRWIGR